MLEKAFHGCEVVYNEDLPETPTRGDVSNQLFTDEEKREEDYSYPYGGGKFDVERSEENRSISCELLTSWRHHPEDGLTIYGFTMKEEEFADGSVELIASSTKFDNGKTALRLKVIPESESAGRIISLDVEELNSQSNYISQIVRRSVDINTEGRILKVNSPTTSLLESNPLDRVGYNLLTGGWDKDFILEAMLKKLELNRKFPTAIDKSFYPYLSVYWTDSGTGKIQRANPDGTGIVDVVTGLDSPQGIVVTNRSLYWTDSGTGKIQRANRDGTGIVDLITGLDSPQRIIYFAGRFYWTSGTGKIQRANWDGTGIVDVVTGLDSPPQGISASGQWLYWTDSGTGKIQRANYLNGTGIVDFVTGLDSPQDIDTFYGYIYWTDSGTGKIQRANRDGTGIVDLVTGLDSPQGIAPHYQHMFWIDSGTGKIQRANRDGTGM